MGKLIKEPIIEQKSDAGFIWMWMMLLDLLSMTLGLVLIYCAWNANSDLLPMLESMVERHYKGQGETSIAGNYVLGLLSGGTLTFVPAWQIRAGYLLGFIFTYIGFAGITYHSRKKKLRIILTRSYWTSFKTSADDV